MTARPTILAVAAITAATLAVLALQGRATGALILIAFTALAVAERIEARA